MQHRRTLRFSRLLFRRFWIVLAMLIGNTSFLAVPQASAQPAPPTPPTPSASRGGIRFLTGPASGDPLVIALDYIRQHTHELGLVSDDLRDITVKDRYVTLRNGVTHLYLRQRLNGVEVFNGDINVNVTRDGRIINLGNGFVGDLAKKANRIAPSIDASQALRQAATDLGLNPNGLVPTQQPRGPDRATELAASGVSADPVPMQLIYQRVADGSVRLAWNMVLRLPERNQWLDLRADAENGKILSQVDWSSDNHDPVNIQTNGRTLAPSSTQPSQAAAPGPNSYDVFPLPAENPQDGTRTVVTNPADSTASPFGWHDTDGVAGAEYTTARGNNTFTYADAFAPDGFGAGDTTTDGGTDLIFSPPLDLSQTPDTYRDAAISQLFYTTNTVHDILYHYGFDEASGNFQENVYGHGGVGSDAVNAEAQDYAGFTNANFSTPPDGEIPRMQMYLGSPELAVQVQAPAAIAGSYGTSAASFGPTTFDVTSDVLLVQDGTAPPTDGCNVPFTNAGALPGKIALIDRGSCNFVVKVKNAQNAGAVGVIIVNNVAGAAPGLGGSDPTITIPALSLSQDDGNSIKSALLSDPVTIRLVSTNRRDGSFDTGVVIHEYGHGLSNRLTGGPSNSACLSAFESKGMGEGWSDFLALSLTARSSDTATTPHPVGTWLMGQQSTDAGIRHFPYTTDMAVNGYTFNDTHGMLDVHDVGEVWASLLWETYWNLTARDGFDADIVHGAGGNNLALQLVIDGMKFQPCDPSFVDARDAILQADLVDNNAANQCAIWEGFAKRGLGYSADAGTSDDTSDNFEAFDLPPVCAVSVAPPEQELCIANVDSVPLAIGLGDSMSGPITLSASDLPPNTTASFASNPITAPSGTTLTITNLGAAPPDIYDVKVTGTDGAANTYEDTTTLYLADAAPGAAALIFPLDGSTDVIEYDPFIWIPSPQAVRYTIEVARDAAFTDLVITDTVSTNGYFPTTDLPELGNYYWRVTSINGCGTKTSPASQFTVRDVPRILLVDDDTDNPDVADSYTTILDNLGIAYDGWDTSSAGNDEPPAGAFTNYKTVIWFGGPNGDGRPTAESETVLANFLDRGNCVAFSAQDYFARSGITPFMQNYLGVAAAVDDVKHANVTGNGPFAGLGPFAFDFTSYANQNFTDLFTPTSSAAAAFTGDKGTAAVYKDTGTYRTVFMGFPIEALSSTNDQQAVIERAINWCDFQTDLSIEQGLTPASTMLPGQPLTYTLSFRNDDIAIATGAQLTVTLPTALKDVQVTSSVAVTTTGTPGVWQIGDIAPGASGIFTITATIDKAISADTDLPIVAQIGSGQFDSNHANNHREANIRVVTPRVSFASATSAVDEGAGEGSVGVILDRANPYADTVVTVTASGGTAQAGNDYTFANGTLTIPAGATSANRTVTVIDDSADEQDETVELTLSNPQGATVATPSSATLTIGDNDGGEMNVRFANSTATVSEGAGTANVQIILSAANPSADTVVAVAVNGGTAQSGSDYTLGSGSVTIPAGATSANVTLTIIDDDQTEQAETVALTISNAQGATVGTPSVATLTITDNDTGTQGSYLVHLPLVIKP